MNPWVHRLQQVQGSQGAAPGGRCHAGTVPPPADRVGNSPCPQCGSREQWQTLAGRWICRPCLLRGHPPIVAVQVWAEYLGEAVWVVADDLPQAEWPQDAPVYTQAELAVLRRVGPDTLPQVHVVKQLFQGFVVDGRRGPVSAPRRPGPAGERAADLHPEPRGGGHPGGLP